MSVKKAVYIYCDGPCGIDEPGNNGEGHLTAYEAREWLKEQGWKFRNGKDYCPNCLEAPKRPR